MRNFILFAAAFALTAQRANAQGPSAVPDSVAATPAEVTAGRAIFHGQGQCLMCHGAGLEGGIGPTLRAHAWRDAKGGDLAAIYYVVTHGVPGTAMVSHPGNISDEQAHAVAAYIWAVSHNRSKP